MLLPELEESAKRGQKVTIDAKKLVALIHKLQSADPYQNLELFNAIEVIATDAIDSVEHINSSIL